MKLIKLEMTGFKSFADHTTLHFDQGVTGIVGPNGCGKSNVVDAFKWVLGEQSAKSLRGGEMQDVIFNGSSTRKPSGMAEVVLTFDNSDRRLPVEQAEVAVGRRLYRDGSSEYLLNKQVVRLKDIRELFMDTGVGVDAYSLVEQGKVDQVLATNPVDRREVFEEAAGISKYRARKREAQRKLERVEQNVLRLTDIVSEVDKRLRSIKAAATKARNYQEYNQRLRELRVSHFLWEYHRFTTQSATAADKVADSQRAVRELSERQQQAESTREELDAAQIALAAELAEAENRLVELTSQLANHADRIRFAADREKELADELDRRRAAMVGLQQRLAELRSQDAELRTAADELDKSAETARARIEEIGREMHAAEIDIHELAGAVERTNDSLFDLMRQVAGLNNKLQEYRTTQVNLSAQRDRLAQRSEQAAAQSAARTAERTDLARQSASLETALAELRERMESTRTAAAAKDAAIRELAAALAELKERRSGLAARRDLLVSLERKLEGIADGPRELLRRQADPQDAADRIDGLEGLVADLFIVAPENVRAVQAALGDREQWLVVRSADALATESAQRMLSNLPGPANLLCLDRLAPGAADDLSAWRSADGVVGCLADMVMCEPVYFPVRDCLLAGTFLADTLDAAFRLAAQASASPQRDHVRFLTRQGYVLWADGRVTVPSQASDSAQARSDSAAAGLIGRKAELRQLTDQLTDLEQRVAQMESELAAASAEAARIDMDLQELRTRTYQHSTEQVKVVGLLRQADQAIDSLKSEQAMLASELADLAARIERARQAEQAGAEEVAQLERRRQETQTAADELNKQLQHKRNAVQSLSQTLTEAKVALGKVDERRLAARQQLTAVRRGLEEALAQQATAHSDSRSLRQRIEQSRQAQLAGEQAVAEIYVSRERFVEQRASLARRLDQARRSLAEVDAAARYATHELRQAEEVLHNDLVAQNELRIRQEDLVQRVGDEYQMDLPAMYAQDRPGDAESATDWSAVEAEIAELRTRIDRLGNVNIEAIDEQEQLQGRSDFLNRQLADVSTARDQLLNLIERLNVESRRRFETCFEQVRSHFQELFRKLFGGGKADLVLENPDDVLESGIEIIARPPGKQLQSISLLSGGERTMTAAALLMSIFRSRPSPFCILDEVDAALDEANNERFNDIIREFLRFSQFIVITHSKRTMQVADVLYGITMQEQGVSRQVAVRFDGRNVRGEQGEKLEEPASAVA